MKKEYLDEYKKKIQILDEKERKLRDLYLRKLSNGDLQGPSVGYPSIDKPWLKCCNEDEINADIPKMKTYDLIYEKRKNELDHTAFIYFNNKIKMKTFFETVEKISKSLKEMGVKEGDIVSVALPNMPEAVYLLYALNRVGAVTDFIDPRLTTDGFNKRLKSTNSRYLFALDMTVNNVSRIDKKLINNLVYLSVSESFPKPLKVIYNLKNRKNIDKSLMNWDKFIELGKNYSGVIDTPYKENQALVIVHTGGTTGEPKGVVLTNENFNSMGVIQDTAKINLNSKDTLLTFLPPFIAYCLTNSYHDSLYMGFENILIPAFEPKDYPKLMHKYKPNHVLSGPILWDLFIHDKLTSKDDLSYMKTAISGGDALNIELEKEIGEFFKSHNAKTTLNQGYGMSEVSAAVCYSRCNAYTLGSVGIPYAKNNIKVVDENGNELGYNEQGEIHISTPTMMKGYLNNYVATHEIIYTENGERWIKTGDIGYINNDGNLFIIGRKKRMIVRSGNKIFPSTIENIIMENDNVSNVAIVGIPDEEERHIPVAHIVLNEGVDNIETLLSDINMSIKEKMPEFNIPSIYVIRKNLPYTDINKVDFKKLESYNISENNDDIYYSNKININKAKILK